MFALYCKIFFFNPKNKTKKDDTVPGFQKVRIQFGIVRTHFERRPLGDKVLNPSWEKPCALSLAQLRVVWDWSPLDCVLGEYAQGAALWRALQKSLCYYRVTLVLHVLPSFKNNTWAGNENTLQLKRKKSNSPCSILHHCSSEGMESPLGKNGLSPLSHWCQQSSNKWCTHK